MEGSGKKKPCGMRVETKNRPCKRCQDSAFAWPIFWRPQSSAATQGEDRAGAPEYAKLKEKASEAQRIQRRMLGDSVLRFVKSG
ncbi:MAG: hypothetical protein LBU32_26540 [Clostridiales bacterium]|nr:hypothetical protein [Clostridiales bacterium]